MNNNPFYRSWKRFLKNRSAVFGLVIIAISVIVAILGYSITPDSTPDANDQILQITNKAPGFQVTVLQKRKNKTAPSTSLFKKMFTGEENTFELIRQLFWWILAASAPIMGIVSATLAMYEIDKPTIQNISETIEKANK